LSSQLNHYQEGDGPSCCYAILILEFTPSYWTLLQDQGNEGTVIHSGRHNYAFVDQDTDNTGYLYQEGEVNKAGLFQNATKNDGSIWQIGAKNFASMKQSGDVCCIDILAVGSWTSTSAGVSAAVGRWSPLLWVMGGHILKSQCYQNVTSVLPGYHQLMLLL